MNDILERLWANLRDISKEMDAINIDLLDEDDQREMDAMTCAIGGFTTMIMQLRNEVDLDQNINEAAFDQIQLVIEDFCYRAKTGLAACQLELQSKSKNKGQALHAGTYHDLDPVRIC